MTYRTKQEIQTYINSLKGYEGYVQFSDRPIEDIWTQKSDISIDSKDGFIYEAHFCNGTQSISIKQINNSWFVSTTDVSNISDEDTQLYHAFEKNVKMAQVWEEVADELCEGMKVQKIKKVVFVGFKQGDSK